VSSTASTAPSSVSASTASSAAASSAAPSVQAEDAQPTASSTDAFTPAAATSSPASSAASSSSAAPAAASSSVSGGASVAGKPALTPNGIKAGMSLCTGIDSFQGHLGWCYDWTPNPTPPSGMIGPAMLWGDGHLGGDDDDASRLTAFEALSGSQPYIIGFEEPDCSTEGSADMSIGETATAWDSFIAPWGAKGSLLISPSMCHQAAENFLQPLEQQISTPWDVTNLHINKNSMDGVNEDLDHYWNTYGKPMWITEFACVDDSNGFVPSTDQGEINTFIQQIVDLFEADSRVYAYAYSNGEGLGNVWPAISDAGELTESGQTYLAAVSKYH